MTSLRTVDRLASAPGCSCTWHGFRFSGDLDAMPEGTTVFAGEPLVLVTARRVEAQLLKTLLLNQINLQTRSPRQRGSHRRPARLRRTPAKPAIRA